MFESVLVANRGEIAYRIITTLQDHGIEAILTASDPDLRTIPARKAEGILHLEGKTAIETYLNIEKIVQKAKEMGIQAIHPGYGFLAENPEFSQATEDAGMVFIGPTPEQMRIFGDKIQARKLAIEAGTHLISGTKTNLSDDEILEKAEEIGFPLLIKAAAGGGGRGIRYVHNPNDIQAQLSEARKEARSAFNDDRVFIEKFIQNGRHVEVQIIGTGDGKILHFGERDCTMQRKNQKLIEEAPAPTISREKAEEIHQAAVNLTSEANYRNAGTVEFLLDNETHEFYFLEVNARIQVEHPVTEFVTGEDLVLRQIQVAAGEDLDLKQNDISLKGHAIEARIYAENPYRNFRPSPGKISRIKHPIGPGIRVDSAVEDTDIITPYYDPMISKLIVFAPKREPAIRKLRKALEDYLISGVHTTAAYIRDLISNDDFVSGKYHTRYLEDYEIPIPREIELAARAMAGKEFTGNTKRSQADGTTSKSKWRTSTWPSYG